MDDELQRRGFADSYSPPKYKDPDFYIDDFDFEEEYLDHWTALEEVNPAVWSLVTRRILLQKPTYWTSKKSAQVIEEASNGRTRTLIEHGVLPS